MVQPVAKVCDVERIDDLVVIECANAAATVSVDAAQGLSEKQRRAVGSDGKRHPPAPSQTTD